MKTITEESKIIHIVLPQFDEVFQTIGSLQPAIPFFDTSDNHNSLTFLQGYHLQRLENSFIGYLDFHSVSLTADFTFLQH